MVIYSWSNVLSELTLDKVTLYEFHAQFCKTLADANRLLIIAQLVTGEKSVTDLANNLDLRQSNVSKHLSLMRERGLVVTRRDGASIYYSLSDPRIFKAIELLVQVQTDQVAIKHNLAQRNK
jgi:ArsR family transcriptional regulator, virulence genes transcriptional regulator